MIKKVTIETEITLRLDDNIDWDDRGGADQVAKDLALAMGIDGYEIANVDGYADLPDSAARIVSDDYTVTDVEDVTE